MSPATARGTVVESIQNGDLLPGTKLGAFGRKIKVNGLNGFLTNYNNTVAGGPTPAGQVLINNGLFSPRATAATGRRVCRRSPWAPDGQVGLGWLKTFDLKFSYPRKFGERFSVEPSVSVFNAFNNANFDLPNASDRQHSEPDTVRSHGVG